MLVSPLQNIEADLERVQTTRVFGRVSGIQGMLIQIGGISGYLSIGDRCDLVARAGRKVRCEVVGFKDGFALAMPYGPLEGIGLGSRVGTAGIGTGGAAAP